MRSLSLEDAWWMFVFENITILLLAAATETANWFTSFVPVISEPDKTGWLSLLFFEAWAILFAFMAAWLIANREKQ